MTKRPAAVVRTVAGLGTTPATTREESFEMKVTAPGAPGISPRHVSTPVALGTRSFPGLPESVREARSWVAGFFASPSALDAALLTSELVTNAIVYSASGLPGGSVTVTVVVADGTVRVDVIDQGQLPVPAPRRHGLGQGLAIVAQLADVFGADGCDRWFALRTGGAS